ncbi:hypothetical protein CANINC_000829 [Pichia inconspicua]|uniref:Alkylphosphocholine resistance protein LEM3 n=1 Tax=Pichia inconspicua TaxID=52247 RepID=A0A4T0X6V2_9ASCO|nr:hypothetical protein CANINC_000829 [[Candida] inconspicua]
MSNFSQGVTNLQQNMHNIFGGLTKRRNVHNNNDDNKDDDDLQHDRADLMEDDDEWSDEEDDKKNKPKSRKPKVTAFTQQKLNAIHPILTAKVIIPILLVIAIIFIPIGAAMLHTSNNVEEFTIDYAKCIELANSNYWTEIPDEYYTKSFKNEVTIKPQWKLSTNNSEIWNDYPEERNICQIQFQIPNDLKNPIYLFYKLTKFHANHRQYVKSFSEDQLNGKRASVSTIKDTVGQNCGPLSIDENGKIIYPCGLIANSLFNDTYDSSLISVNNTINEDYSMSQNGISWSTNSNRFKMTSYNYTDIVPPPNWIKKFPNGYNETNIPDISKWEEFQNWMSPAVLSDFANLIMRNDNDILKSGIYQVNIGFHFPTTEYNGGKMIYLSTSSKIGGKNPFLGISWIIAGAICVALSIILGVGSLFKGRKSGDTSLLSWNKE